MRRLKNTLIFRIDFSGILNRMFLRNIITGKKESMNKLISYLVILLLLVLFLPAAVLAADVPESGPAKLIIFHSPSCHRCIQAKQEVMPSIEQEFKDKIIFEYRDVSQVENYKMLLGLLQGNSAGLKFQVPLFYLRGKFLSAQGQLRDNLRSFIAAGLKRNSVLGLNSVDLVAHFKSFVPAAVIVAGLSDGINPCAFTVIVFFISFLALQGYRKIELILIGLAFVLAVFLTYLGLGLGIFNFLYHFAGFWVVTHLLNIIIGIFSILLGIFAIYDFIEFKKTGSTEGLLLQLPKPIKERIHKVVGFFYRKSLAEKQEKSNPSLSRLLLSALITGFLVSLLEAVCTGQVYLPTITFVLKSTTLKFQAFGYLLLYNIMFIAPLIVIFVLALLGTTSQQFSGFLKKHLRLIKILMAILFFGLGIYLLWRA
jgi:cytochrome c biogenesis protein CcdA